MLVSLAFGVLLLVVVAVYYLVPRPERCPECGSARGDEPLCGGCGWVFAVPYDDDDEDDDSTQEPEVIDDWEAR